MSDDVDQGTSFLSLSLSSQFFLFLLLSSKISYAQAALVRMRERLLLLDTFTRIAYYSTQIVLPNDRERQMTICRLVDGDVFAGMERTLYLSLADNEVPSIPRHILSHMSLLMTLDLSRNRISRIDSDDFRVRIGSDLGSRLRFVRSLAHPRATERERKRAREVASREDVETRCVATHAISHVPEVACCLRGSEFSDHRREKFRAYVVT